MYCILITVYLLRVHWCRKASLVITQTDQGHSRKLHSTAFHFTTLLYATIHYTTLYSSSLHCTKPHFSIHLTLISCTQYNTSNFTVLYWSLQNLQVCPVLYFTISLLLYFTLLYNTLLYCTVQYNTSLSCTDCTIPLSLYSTVHYNISHSGLGFHLSPSCNVVHSTHLQYTT